MADRDPDFEAADSLARQWEGFSDLANLKEARNIARAYLATRAELERRRDEERRLQLWQRQTGGTATRFPDGSWRLHQPHPTMGRAEHARTLDEALNKMGEP